MNLGHATRDGRALVAGCLAALLLLAPAWGKPKSDWSRVRAVPEGTKTQVLLYQEEASLDARKIRGLFVSATESSVTLMVPVGKSRWRSTFERRAVQKVRVPRPWYKRYPGWIALGAGVVVLEWLRSGEGSEDNDAWVRKAYPRLLLPATMISFLSATGTKEIYNVPPKHRIP